MAAATKKNEETVKVGEENKSNNLPATEAAGETVGSSQTEGTRARRALMLKQLLPGGDWINLNVVAGGKGTRAVVGRIFGIATSTKRRTNTLPDGKTLESIVVGGAFQSESYITGELSDASNVFFPMAYAEKLEALFAADESIHAIDCDCDVGLEATGKTIPYEWVIVAYREGKEMDTLKRLKSSRQRPASLLTLANGKPGELKALGAPK